MQTTIIENLKRTAANLATPIRGQATPASFLSYERCRRLA